MWIFETLITYCHPKCSYPDTVIIMVPYGGWLVEIFREGELFPAKLIEEELDTVMVAILYTLVNDGSELADLEG